MLFYYVCKILNIILICIFFNQTKRFSEEVTNDTVALSGMKFFYLTRGLVLSVAGTIVTYELVLLQFHENDKVLEEPNEYIC